MHIDELSLPVPVILLEDEPLIQNRIADILLYATEQKQSTRHAT